MRQDGDAIRGHDVLSLRPGWEGVKVWARKAFAQERMAETAVAGATLVAAGYVVSALRRAFQAYTIGGF